MNEATGKNDKGGMAMGTNGVNDNGVAGEASFGRLAVLLLALSSSFSA